MKTVVVVGSSNVDLIMRSKCLPAVGETRRDGVFSSALGGKGANQAITARRMGAEVLFVSRLGADEYGHRLVETFKSEGFEMTFVSRDAYLPTGIAMIGIDQQGQNTIVVASGANGALTPGHIYEAEVAFQRADIVLLQLEIPLETVMASVELAAKHQKRIILNPAPAAELPQALYRHLDIIIPNEIEAQMLTGFGIDSTHSLSQAAQYFLDKGVKQVVITLGQRGSFVKNADNGWHVPAFKVAPVDTTGAGDVFCGIIANSVAEGMPVSEAVQWASAGAALSTTRYGAIPSIPDHTQVAAFLNGNPGIHVINL